MKPKQRGGDVFGRPNINKQRNGPADRLVGARQRGSSELIVPDELSDESCTSSNTNPPFSATRTC